MTDYSQTRYMVKLQNVVYSGFADEQMAMAWAVENGGEVLATLPALEFVKHCGAERRAEGTSGAGRSGDHNPTPDATGVAQRAVNELSDVIGFYNDARDLGKSHERAVEYANKMAGPVGSLHAARIVACVNACEGIATDALGEIAGQLPAILRSGAARCDSLAARNAELEAALRGLLDACTVFSKGQNAHDTCRPNKEAWAAARSALAAYKGVKS